jgi:flagellar biosynthetic protein FlhB
MADNQDQSQKTEEPTQKKLDDAHKKGQGVSSREVANWFMLVAGTIVVIAMAPYIMNDIGNSLRPFLERPHLLTMGEGDEQGGLATVVREIILSLLAPLGIFVVAALASGFVQRGFSFSFEPMKPELSKISIFKGAKRLFSMRSLVEFLKGVAKISIVGLIGTMILMPELDRIEDLISISPLQWLDRAHDLIVRLLVGVCAIMTVIAGLDYMYQRYEFRKQMMMSRQDIKDEHKQSEGDPLVRAKIRQLRQERARHRMIASVPEADVVVTNPTHYAVALKYDTETMRAPKVVAKGSDEVALRVREVAIEHDVPIVENPPLARALFGAVEIDQEVPLEHYKAVAEVIGYVWRLKGKMGQNGADARAG